MTSPSDCSHLTWQGHSPYGRPARETLLGGEWRVLSLRALPPRYRAGGELSSSRPRSLGSTWREQLAFEKAAWVYSLYSPVYTAMGSWLWLMCFLISVSSSKTSDSQPMDLTLQLSQNKPGYSSAIHNQMHIHAPSE